MLSNDRKRIRHEERGLEMRERLSVRPLSPARQEEQTRLLAAEKKKLQHERNREEWRFTLMGRYLDQQAKAIQEEQYVTAMWGVKTSWQRIERHAIYYVWRSKAGFVTRRYLTSRPAWGSNIVNRIDKHHMASKVVPIRPPLRESQAPERRAA